MGKGDTREGYSESDIARLIEKDRAIKRLDVYRDALAVFMELIKGTKKKVALVLEGRDAAGKGYTIKWATEYVRATAMKIIALGIPTKEEREKWFERYEQFLPGDGQLTAYDRSWYNRMLVEPVMGFCTKGEYDWCTENVIPFEQKLQEKDPDLALIKVYLSVSKKEQIRRLRGRSKHIRKNWKKSPVDKEAISRRAYYTEAKQRMLEKTHRTVSPWHIVDSDDRIESVIEVIKLIINSHADIAQKVKEKVDVDLTMDSEIYRGGYEELQRMRKRRGPDVRKELNFKKEAA